MENTIFIELFGIHNVYAFLLATFLGNSFESSVRQEQTNYETRQTYSYEQRSRSPDWDSKKVRQQTTSP